MSPPAKDTSTSSPTFGKNSIPHWEPLIGVYDRALHAQIEPLIREHGAPVRALMESCPCQRWPSQLPEPFWTNCNTPEAYQSLLNG